MKNEHARSVLFKCERSGKYWDKIKKYTLIIHDQKIKHLDTFILPHYVLIKYLITFFKQNEKHILKTLKPHYT